jgi:superfamily II DNA or RNA helicase
MFLNFSPKSIGHIGGGKMDRTGCVDVAMIQSLYRKDRPMGERVVSGKSNRFTSIKGGAPGQASFP